LLDGGYLKDPTFSSGSSNSDNSSIFYVPMQGKIPPVAGQPLKPENVCFDVTSPMDQSSPDALPVVFLTGYKVNYVPGGAAVLLSRPALKSNGWWQRLWKRSGQYMMPGIVVSYKDDSFRFLRLNNDENPDSSIPNFVPANFDAKGKSYRQLTPTGVMGN
jgi:hypothetical protein